MKKRIDLYEMLIVAIVVVGVLVMTMALYLDIKLMERMNERLSEAQFYVCEVDIPQENMID